MYTSPGSALDTPGQKGSTLQPGVKVIVQKGLLFVSDLPDVADFIPEIGIAGHPLLRAELVHKADRGPAANSP